jgi:orotate phosphoribosyltransferase
VLLDQLRKKYIEGIYKTKALLIKEAAFRLQSGKRSHIYLNHRHFLTNHIYLILVAKLYNELIPSFEEKVSLGVVDSIMSPIIVGTMCALFKYDFMVIKKTAMTHGTEEFIFGKRRKEVVLIDDMTSTGETLIDAALKLRQQGCLVRTAIISAYRDDYAIKNLNKQNIELKFIASFDTIISQLNPMLTRSEQKIVQTNPLIFD